MFRFVTKAELHLVKLKKVLADYAKLAYQNPSQLRLLIPSAEVWRFFIDGNLQKSHGWQGFEKREPGYLKALYAAYDQIYDLVTPLSIDYISKLHQLAISDVIGTNYHKKNISPTLFGKFRQATAIQYGIGFYQEYDNVSREGLYEFFAKNSPHNFLKIEYDKNSNGLALTLENIELLRVCVAAAKSKKVSYCALDVLNELNTKVLAKLKLFRLPTAEKAKSLLAVMAMSIGKTKNLREVVNYIVNEVHPDFNDSDDLQLSVVSYQAKTPSVLLSDAIQTLVNQYQADIVTAKNYLDRLKAIVVFIQACEQLHPFVDANCRTFCMLLCNNLLMRNGMPPAIFYNPNRFDCLSTDELIMDVIEGMQNTMILIKTGKLFDITLTESLASTSSVSADNVASLQAYFIKTVTSEVQAQERPCKRRKLI
jgi:hypothetical protein